MTVARRLSRMTFITNLGDFVSLFACLSLVHQTSNSVLLSALLIPVGSIAVCVAGITLPSIASLMSFPRLLFITQTISGFLTLGIGFGGVKLSPYVVLALYFCISYLKNIFDVARDSYAAPSDSNHRHTWATVYFGRYGAQVLGPLLAMVLVKIFPLWVPFAFDAATFFGCAWLATSLEVSPPQRFSIISAMKRVLVHPAQRTIFVIRGILCWVPLGISNYLSFNIMTEHFGRVITDSAWIYVFGGTGAAVGAILLRDQDSSRIPFVQRMRAWLRAKPDWYIALTSLIYMGLARAVYFKTLNIYIGLAFVVIGSLFMATHALSSQAIRSKVAKGKEFTELVSLELTTAKIVEFGVASLVGWSIGGLGISLEWVLGFAVVGYVMAGLAYLKIELN